MSDPQPPAQRPQPRYGEYAPEGWQPVTSDPAQGSGSAPASEPTRPGVPHNLGLGAAGESTPVDQPAYLAQPQHHAASPTPPPAGRQPSVADRVITIVLLVIGAFGALQFALGMLTLGTQLEIIATTLGAENFTLPAGMTILQSVGTITMLSIFAVALIWSVQRLRAKKIAFWVPLSGGVLAFILLFVFALIGIVMVPELIELSSPENAQLLLEQLEQLR